MHLDAHRLQHGACRHMRALKHLMCVGAIRFADAWVTSWSKKSGDRCFNGCLLDEYMPDEEQPRIDSGQDLLQPRVSISGSQIFAEFVRLLDTGMV